MDPYGGWSNWAPHPTTANFEYRFRYDQDGKPQYDYRDTSRTAEPRSTSAEDAMASLTLNDPQPQDQVYPGSTGNYGFQGQGTPLHSGNQYQQPVNQYPATYTTPQYGQPQHVGSQYSPYSATGQYNASQQADFNHAINTHNSMPLQQHRNTQVESPKHKPKDKESRRQRKGKAPSSQQPTEPFYQGPRYYPPEQSQAQGQDAQYYTAPANDNYNMGVGVEDVAQHSTSGFTNPMDVNQSSPVPSSNTPISKNRDSSKIPNALHDTTGTIPKDFQFEQDTAEAISQSKVVYNDPFAVEGGPASEPYFSYTAGPSSTGTAYIPDPTDTDPQYSVQPSSYDTPGDYDEGAPPTPSQIEATDGEREKLDPRFRVHHSSAFELGRVFKVLWADPKGGSGREDATDTVQFKDSLGESFYVGIRRFIIIASDEGNSTCVPILTYRKLGCRKPGVKSRTHGIIYGDADRHNKRAKLLDGEPKMGIPPVCMRSIAAGEKLARESRVNYAKLLTIEHNVKVFFIGKLEGEDFQCAMDGVDKCWNDKNRDPKRRRH